MIVLHGIARYGRVDQVNGEYLVTRFHHLFTLPLVPLGSEWITHHDELGPHGRACQLAWKSVLAAYVRWWGAVAAVVLALVAAATADMTLLLPAAIVATLALATVTLRRQDGARELRRIALQRRVLGVALDPRRLPRDTAALLLPVVQERFDATSGGRTAMDVARDGAPSPDVAAHAFVVLRLVSLLHVGLGAADAFAASERLIDGTGAAANEDGPFRAAAPIGRATVSAPLLASYLLARHRWYGVSATLALWLGCCVCLPSFSRRICDCSQRVDDIARAGVKKLAYEAYPQWRMKHPAPRCPNATELAEYGGSTKDPWGEPYFVICEGRADGGLDVAVWSSGANRRDERGLGDDVSSRHE